MLLDAGTLKPKRNNKSKLSMQIINTVKNSTHHNFFQIPSANKLDNANIPKNSSNTLP